VWWFAWRSWSTHDSKKKQVQNEWRFNVFSPFSHIFCRWFVWKGRVMDMKISYIAKLVLLLALTLSMLTVGRTQNTSTSSARSSRNRESWNRTPIMTLFSCSCTTTSSGTTKTLQNIIFFLYPPTKLRYFHHYSISLCILLLISCNDRCWFRDLSMTMRSSDDKK